MTKTSTTNFSFLVYSVRGRWSFSIKKRAKGIVVSHMALTPNPALNRTSRMQGFDPAAGRRLA